MQLSVKTLKGTSFKITVRPSDTIIAVKKNIEEVQGKDNYPWGQQILIHQGKILKDESTLEEIKISENDFLVVMLTKNKTSSTAGASSVTQSSTAPTTSSTSHYATSEAPLAPASANVTPSSEILLPEVFDGPATYDQAASNLVAGNNRELIIQELMDLGNGNWNKDTVLLALRAAYNNPTRAVEYLYSGIPAATEASIPAAPFPSNPASRQAENTAEEMGAGPSPHFGLPNSAPLNMFPQGTPSAGAGAGAGSLDFLRHNQQFQALRAMVQANPQILQPMLQELSKQNPQLLRLIQEHHAEFLQLINEPVEGLDGDLFDQPEQEMPHAISATPAEQEAIERLEAMGFDRGRIIEAFLACDRNEELAANYLLEHSGDED